MTEAHYPLAVQPEDPLMQSIANSFHGQFLVSMPDLRDSFFDSTLVLMCEHSAEGAMGFVVNKQTEFSVKEIFAQLGIEDGVRLDDDIPVMSGGPVEPQRGFLLLNYALTADVVEILDGLFLASSPDVLPLAVDALNEGNALFVLGYSGWSANQLEQEFQGNAWLNVPWDADIIFQVPSMDRQRAALAQLGIDPVQLSQGAGHA